MRDFADPLDSEGCLIELMINILEGQIEQDQENIREFMSRL